MMIDPLTFVPEELERRLAAARAAQFARDVRLAAPGARRRGLRLRLAVWLTGRAIHA